MNTKIKIIYSDSGYWLLEPPCWLVLHPYVIKLLNSTEILAEPSDFDNGYTSDGQSWYKVNTDKTNCLDIGKDVSNKLKSLGFEVDSYTFDDLTLTIIPFQLEEDDGQNN